MTKLHGAAEKFVEGNVDVSQFSTASSMVCSTSAPPLIRAGLGPRCHPIHGLFERSREDRTGYTTCSFRQTETRRA